MERMTAQPQRGFTRSEFECRTARAQEIMHRHKLDALLLTTPANVRYFTGFDTQFWESPTRPWFVVVPLKGVPIAVIPEIGAPEMGATWIEDIRTWPAPRPEDDGASLLTQTLSSLPRRYGQIGAELGREISLRMPVIEFLALRDLLHGISLSNGTPCLWEIRMIKTEAEVAHLRYICQLASAAYEAVPGFVRIGDTERAVCRKFRNYIAELGADGTPFLPAISGPGGVSQIVCGPHDRVLREGDILFIDTGSTYDGYYCDFDRNYAIGSVSAEVQRAHEAVWRATEAGIAAAVPGATPEAIWRTMSQILQEAGSIGSNVGRLGHGLGLQLTEPPSNMPGDRTPLKPNFTAILRQGIEKAEYA